MFCKLNIIKMNYSRRPLSLASSDPSSSRGLDNRVMVWLSPPGGPKTIHSSRPSGKTCRWCSPIATVDYPNGYHDAHPCSLTLRCSVCMCTYLFSNYDQSNAFSYLNNSVCVSMASNLFSYSNYRFSNLAHKASNPEASPCQVLLVTKRWRINNLSKLLVQNEEGKLSSYRWH